MADEVGSIFSSVSIDLVKLQQQAIKGNVALRDMGVTLGYVGKKGKEAASGIGALGTSMGKALGVAAKYYLAYQLIRGVLGGVTKAFQDLKDLEMEAIFIEPALAGENLASVLKEVAPLSKKWGVDLIETYRGTLQISRALSDMYEITIPEALALTDVAMKITVTTGQNLNETISNMVGYIRLLRMESVGDIEKFMSTLYAAAYLTNESLTKSGKAVKGGAVAMDTLTDAVQRMLPSMVRFGLTQGQIAAIASVFITNLDEAGQGIGAYSAKLFESIKNNQQLIDVYKDVGVELNREAGELLPALVTGYRKMTDAQKDLAASSTQIGIGAHIVATFWEGLNQIQERSIFIQENSNLLNIKAIDIMGTLQKKQDRLAASWQSLGITAGRHFLPVIKVLVDSVNALTFASEGMVQAVPRSFSAFIQAARAGVMAMPITLLAEGIKAAIKELKDPTDYQKVAENMKLIRREMEAAMTGGTTGGALLLEKTKEVMKEWTREVKIATYALGPYASKVSVAYAKLTQLENQLEALQNIRAVQEGDVGAKQLREWDEVIAKTTFQAEEQRKIIRDINNELTIGHKYRMMEIAGLSETTIIQEKLRDLEREKIALREKGLNVSGKQLEIDQLHLEQQEETNREWASISGRIEGVVSSGIKGLIRGTKEWKDVLADIGGTILDIIIEKLVHALFTGQDLGSVFGNIFGAIGGVSGGAGAITSYTTTGMGSIAKAGVGLYHKGGVIKDLIGGLPKFAVGGEVPIMAKPGEFVVQNGPSQTHRGILEAINAGAELGGKTENITYQIYAADARSFTQLLYQNKGAVHGIVREAQRYSMPGFRNRSD